MKALFISFPAADYAASKQFFETSVGLLPLRESIDGPHRFTNYDLGGPVLKVFEWTEPWYGSGHSGLFIETADLDAAVDRIRDGGGEVHDIEVYAWGGRCATVRDPFGNLFDLIDANQKGDA
jgi:predicted enzyme related to lactoylglutathione lyase